MYDISYMIFQCGKRQLEICFCFRDLQVIYSLLMFVESYLLILWLDAGVLWAWISRSTGSSISFEKSVGFLIMWSQLNYSLSTTFALIFIFYPESCRSNIGRYLGPRCTISTSITYFFRLFLHPYWGFLSKMKLVNDSWHWIFAVGLLFYQVVHATLPSLSSWSLPYILVCR